MQNSQSINNLLDHQHHHDSHHHDDHNDHSSHHDVHLNVSGTQLSSSPHEIGITVAANSNNRGSGGSHGAVGDDHPSSTNSDETSSVASAHVTAPMTKGVTNSPALPAVAPPSVDARVSLEFQMRSTHLYIAKEQQTNMGNAAIANPTAQASVQFKGPKSLLKIVMPSLKGSGRSEGVYDKEVQKQVKQDLKVDYHMCPLEDLEKRYESNLKAGLAKDTAAKKLRTEGTNEIKIRRYV